MKIILKHTMKNIFRKPLRTFLISVCLFISCFSAILSIDFTENAEKLIFESIFSAGSGKADIFLGYSSDAVSVAEQMPFELSYIVVYQKSQKFYKRKPAQYTYAESTNVFITGGNTAQMRDMGLIDENISDVKPGEAVITEKTVSKFGVSQGDTLELYDSNGTKVPFVIREIIPESSFLGDGGVIISEEDTTRLGIEEECALLFIDIKDKSRVQEAKDYISEAIPGSFSFDLSTSEEVKNIIKLIKKAFAALFSVCTAVLIVIIMNVSGRIINERMSSAATLRSLGVSEKSTTFFMTLENIIYALFGSVPAVILYTAVRSSLYNTAMKAVECNYFEYGKLSPVLIAAVVLCSVVLTAGCAILENAKAKFSNIRDLIFMNRETEYRFSGVQTITGIVFAVAAAVLIIFFRKSIAAVTGSFMCALIAFYLLVPYVTVYVLRAAWKTAGRRDTSLFSLALLKASTGKAGIGNSQLMAVSAAVVVMTAVFADSLYKVMTPDVYKSDIIVGYQEYDNDYIDYLDGVTMTQRLMETDYMTVEINGNEVKYVNVFSTDRTDLFSGIKGLEELPDDDEIYLTEGVASVCGIRKGEKAVVKFDSEMFTSVRMEFTAAGIVRTEGIGVTGNVIVVSPKVLKEITQKYSETVLLKTESEKTQDVIDKINYYSGSDYCAMEKEQYMYIMRDDSRIYVLIIKAVSFLVVLFASAAVVSNQLIGFEGRKRECAALMSVALTRKQMKKLLFYETFVTSLPVLAVSVPAGILLAFIMRNAVRTLNVDIPLVINPAGFIPVLTAMLVIFTLTVIFPCARLGRMNLSDELKYE